MSRRSKQGRAVAKRAAAEGKTAGQVRYELQLVRQPLYQNGKPRPQWSELSDSVRRAWEQIQE